MLSRKFAVCRLLDTISFWLVEILFHRTLVISRLSGGVRSQWYFNGRNSTAKVKMVKADSSVTAKCSKTDRKIFLFSEAKVDKYKKVFLCHIVNLSEGRLQYSKLRQS